MKRIIYIGAVVISIITLYGCTKDENSSDTETTIDGWTLETAAPDVVVANGEINATLDQEGKVHICYYDDGVGSNQSSIKYTTNQSGSWKTTTIATSDISKYFEGGTCGIAVDEAGHAHIVHAITDNNDYDGTNYSSIVYTNNVSGQWVSRTIFPDTDQDGMFFNCGLEMDHQGKMHIVGIYAGLINDISGDYIVYASNASGDWIHETVTKLLEFIPAGPRISIDGLNIPHVGYSQNDCEDLYAANRVSSGNWNNHRLVQNAGQGNSGSMFVSALDLTTDISGNESAVFAEIEQGKFWLYDQNLLSFLAMEPGGNIASPKILTDSEGYLHYLYGIIHGDYYILYYGANDLGGYMVTQILGFHAYSGNSELLYDAKNSTAYIIYCDETNKLKIAHKMI